MNNVNVIISFASRVIGLYRADHESMRDIKQGGVTENAGVLRRDASGNFETVPGYLHQ